MKFSGSNCGVRAHWYHTNNARLGKIISFNDRESTPNYDRSPSGVATVQINAQRPRASIRHSQGSQSRLRKHPRSISDRRRRETAMTQDVLCICDLDSSVGSFFFPFLIGCWGLGRFANDRVEERPCVSASQKSQCCRQMWPGYSMGHTHEIRLDIGPLNNGSGS